MLTRRNAARAVSEAPLFKAYLQLCRAKGSMQQCVGKLQQSCVVLCERVQNVADGVLCVPHPHLENRQRPSIIFRIV